MRFGKLDEAGADGLYRLAFGRELRAGNAMDGGGALVPLGPARGRADEVGLADAVLFDPTDFDRIALLAEGGRLEIEEQPALAQGVSPRTVSTTSVPAGRGFSNSLSGPLRKSQAAQSFGANTQTCRS